MRTGCMVLAVALASAAFGQTARPNMRQFDTRQGLSSEHVTAIVKDHQGHLWIGTGDGLNRYDGKEVKVYRAHGAKALIRNDHINALAVDGGGQLIIAGNGPHLTILDPLLDTAFHYSYKGIQAFDTVYQGCQSVFVEGDGDIWLGHGRNKLLYFDRRTHEFKSHVLDGPWLGRGRDLITGIIRDDHGMLWLSTHFGLVRFDPTTGAYAHFHNPIKLSDQYAGAQDHVYQAMLAGNGLLLATRGGVFRFDLAAERFDLVFGDADRADNVFTCFAPKGAGELWLAAAELGLFIMDLRTMTVTRCDRSLDLTHRWDSTPAVFDARVAYTDAEGNTWLGTGRNGMVLIAARENRFRQVALPRSTRGVYPYEVMGFRPAGSGMVSVYTNTESVYTMSMTGKVHEHVLLPSADVAFPILHDLLAAGRSTLLSGNNGIWSHASTGGISRPRWPVTKDLLAASSGSIAGDGATGIWVHQAAGIVHIDTLTGRTAPLVERHPQLEPHLAGRLRLLWLDDRRRLWIVFVDRPVVVLRPDGTFFTIGRGDSATEVPGVFITEMVDDGVGGAWASSWDNGLYHFELKGDALVRCAVYTTAHGLPSNHVYHLTKDPIGRLWGATKSGLFMFDPVNGRIITFGRSEGLSELDRNLPLSVIGNTLLVACTEGCFAADIDQVVRPASAPRLWISCMEVFGRPRSRDAGGPGDAIKLGHEEHQVSFLLRTSNLVDQARDRVAYRLLGVDTGWTETRVQERIAFSHLPPAAYVFEARARTGGSTWSPTVRAVFVIAPPWWRTWWGRALGLVLVAGLIHFAFRAMVARRLRRQGEAFALQQAIADERLRIAADMHDDIGSGLSVIKVKSEIAALRESDPRRAQELRQLASASNELIDNMRQMVWSIGGGQEQLRDLVSYLRSHAAEYFEQHGIIFTSELKGDVPPMRINARSRQEVLRMLREAMHNVVRHAQATRVELHLIADRAIILELRDNGAGAIAGTPPPPGTGNGTRTMRQRAQALGGSFERIYGTGTVVRFTFPFSSVAEWAERPRTPEH